MTGIDVPTEVAPGLYLSGSRQPFPALDLDIDVVMCRKGEAWYKPKARRRVHLPIEDVTFADADPYAVTALAEDVAACLRRRERVLVRCHWGLERSAVVVALALHRLMPDASLDLVVKHLRFARDFTVLAEDSVALDFLRSLW
ncbi:MAG TPA: hypothetical protein VFJ14_10275 [Nocardioidaceae bacterium]|nr:hypothetical protein [Nocardioidaceae bacterium]